MHVWCTKCGKRNFVPLGRKKFKCKYCNLKNEVRTRHEPQVYVGLQSLQSWICYLTNRADWLARVLKCIRRNTAGRKGRKARILTNCYSRYAVTTHHVCSKKCSCEAEPVQSILEIVLPVVAWMLFGALAFFTYLFYLSWREVKARRRRIRNSF